MRLNWDALGGLAMMIAFALAAFAPIPAWGRAAGSRPGGRLGAGGESRTPKRPKGPAVTGVLHAAVA